MSANAKADASEEILPGQLCPGLFVRLPSGWMSHPFLFNQFRIANEQQVAILRGLGLEKISYLPSRSTARPLPAMPVPAAAPAPPPPAAPGDGGAAGRAREGQRTRQRARIAQCEQHYLTAAGCMRDLMLSIHADPEQAVVASREMVGGLVTTFAEEGELAIHLMGERAVEGNPHYHALNVMILSLLLGRACRLLPGELRAVGEGALFHDLGKCRVPDSILRNPERNRHEEEFYRLHTVYGAELARSMDIFSPTAVAIIECHHESLDGKGFPQGLSGERLALPVRIVGLANRYDNLCNAQREERSLTPALAMTHLYRNEQGRWGRDLLESFIHTLGVYPPGSLVQLSNGNLALVLAVNQGDLLRPEVLVYDQEIPRSEALIVDLAEAADVRVDNILPSRELAPEVRAYLMPPRRLSYYPGRER